MTVNKMSIEEMIDLVAEHVPMRGNGQDLAAPIIAAIRAGQGLYEEKMYDIIREQGRCDDDTRSPAMVAWDAAFTGMD